jgi:hypothetical protein
VIPPVISPVLVAGAVAVVVAVVATTVVVVILTVRHDARVNAALDAEHETRVRRWVDAARSGRGDPTPQQSARRALPSGAPRAAGSGSSRGSEVSS